MRALTFMRPRLGRERVGLGLLEVGLSRSSVERTEASSSHRGYRPQLDTLRAVAVLGVLVEHTLRGHSAVTYVGPGFLGVALFFVLSGFLISRILYSTVEAAGLKPFYARRTLRIMPLYYLVLLCTAVIGGSELGWSLLFHATFLSNWWFYLSQTWDGLTAHFWTLGVEEQFYLVWPVILAKTPSRYWRLAVTGLIVGGLGTRTIALILGAHHFTFALPTYHLDLFGLGAALGLWIHRADPPDWLIRRLSLFSLITGASLLTLIAVWHGTARLVGETALGVLGIGLINVAVIAAAYVGLAGPGGRVASWLPLVLLGRISYGVYAWHLIARLGAERVLGTAGFGSAADTGSTELFLLTTALSVAFAVVSWYFLESRLLALKDRFPYQRSGLQQG